MKTVEKFIQYLLYIDLQIVTEKGYHLDIRLPSITSSLTSAGDHKSPTFKAIKKHTTVLSGSLPNSPESGIN